MAQSGDNYCFACGEKNPVGLHLKFEKVDEKIIAKKILAREYEGYEGAAHGGIVATMLDEAMCRFIKVFYDEQAMTGRLEIRYKHPTPIEQELTITAWQESQRRNIITMCANITTVDGVITAEATAKFAVVALQ
ncbi:MAG: PaaI family thioesterase [Selenomonadaceae bacterium]|nr:PaaI family thioesterase [Selenomonadaceae bacterium]